MFAIVEISGEQFKVDSNTKTLRVPFMLDAEAGKVLSIPSVMMSSDDKGGITMGGKPGFKATVAGHTRGEKVIVFHKKRRKGYRKTNGHTAKYTELSISW